MVKLEKTQSHLVSCIELSLLGRSFLHDFGDTGFSAKKIASVKL